VVAIRPTFGRVSRSGLVAVASSLDQLGVCARTVDDAAALLEVVAGRDPRDATTADLEVDRLRPPGGPFEDGRPLRGVRIGRPKQYFGDDVTPAVRAAVDAAIALARDLGAHVEDVSLEHSELALPAYHAVAAVEAASNLARYDGVRFGATSGAAGARAVYDGARAGFGPEVVRRVTLGTHLLSRADRAGSYRRAQEARARIARDLADALGDVDLLVTPTTPAPAPTSGDVDADAALRQDAFTVGPSLAGLPAVTIPVGRVGGVPVGAQLVGRHFGEQLLLRAAAALERAVGPEVRA
jgi:aspartyl-tRNA(Asn)/glutamyl-tRNA(Gln) amidotransferase subunit A